jgi:hypothetical protein
LALNRNVYLGVASQSEILNLLCFVVAMVLGAASLLKIFLSGQYYSRKLKKLYDTASRTLIRKRPAGANADGSTPTVGADGLPVGAGADREGVVAGSNPLYDPSAAGGAAGQKKKNKKLDKLPYPRSLLDKSTLRHMPMYHVHSYY